MANFDDELRKRRMAIAKKKGMSDDDINRSLLVERADNLAWQKRQAAEQAQQKKGGRGGPLTAFISELGGTGGAIGGAATGAAIGSVVPGIGTAIGGVVGGIAGGFAGGFGGSAVEQKVRDDNVDWGKAGVEGAFSAIPGGVGKSTKVIAKGTGKSSLPRDVIDLFKPKPSEGTSSISRKGADIRAGNRGAVTGGKMEGRTPSLRPKEADEINEFLNSISAKGSVKKQISTVEAAQQNAADNIKGIVTTKPKPVTPDDIFGSTNRVKDRIVGRNGDGVGGFNPDTHGSIANDYAKQMAGIKDSSGWLAFKRSLDDDINYSRTSQSVDPKREQIAQLFRNEAKQQLEKLHPEVAPYNKTYGDAENAMNVLIKNANPKGIKVGPGAIDTGGRGAFGSARQAATDTVGRVMENPTASTIGSRVGTTMRRATTPGARQFYGQVGASTLSPTGQPMQQPGDDLSMLFDSPQSSDEDVLNQLFASGEPTDFDSLAGSLDSYNNSPDSGGAAGGLQYSSQDLMNTAMQALQAGDSASYKVYADAAMKAADMEAAQAKASGGAGGSTKGMSAESSKIVNNAKSGLTSLQQLQSMMDQQGGVSKATLIPGRSLFGGAIGNALGTAGYDTASKNIVDVITRLRTGAALTESEERFYKSQVPQAFDPPEVRQQKMQLFQDLFSGIVTDTKGGGSSFEDQLMAMMGGGQGAAYGY